MFSGRVLVAVRVVKALSIIIPSAAGLAVVVDVVAMHFVFTTDAHWRAPWCLEPVPGVEMM